MTKKTNTRSRMAYSDEDLPSIRKVSVKELTKEQKKQYDKTRW